MGDEAACNESCNYFIPKQQKESVSEPSGHQEAAGTVQLCGLESPRPKLDGIFAARDASTEHPQS